ncbi:unnamed protein product [Penicillium salamii]|uniref:Uncharacterized protein n=1 Tax=Penicillium salamii TaxID=1612424 RepID=A0A9W4IL69_9EURO|nr:unnamed protein product [Penicillium salamii]
MWSNDNYGCTGYSASFSQLNGNDCSDLSQVVDDTREDLPALDVDACGTENGLPAASIRVNQNGIVTFFNQGGDHSECTLNDKFKVGSWCSVVDFTSAPSLGSSMGSARGSLTSSMLANEASSSSSTPTSSTASAGPACTCSAV